MKAIEKKLYSHSELETQLEQQLSELDHQWTNDAEIQGQRNKPALTETNVKPYVSQFHHKAQAIINHISSVLQPTILISEVLESEKTMERKVRELTNKLTPIKEELHRVKKQLENCCRPFGKWRMPIVFVAMCIPLVAEALLNTGSFEAYGYNFIEACGISMLLAGALAILANFFDRFVSIGTTVWQRRGIAFGILLILTAFFCFIAELRAQALTTDAQSNGAIIHFSPLPIALLSLLLFLASVAVKHFGAPGKDQREAMREYQKLVKKYQALSDERSGIEQAIEAIKEEHDELTRVNASIYLYGSKLEVKVINRTHSAFGKWISTNIMHRPDGGRPVALFNNDEYPFTFQRNFKDIDFK